MLTMCEGKTLVERGGYG